MQYAKKLAQMCKNNLNTHAGLASGLTSELMKNSFGTNNLDLVIDLGITDHASRQKE